MIERIGMFDESFDNLEKAARIATGRQAAISQNIANAKTPGYIPLEFNEELMKAEKRLDRKQVVLEDELAALTENSIKYSSLVKLMTSKLGVLRTIATQGRR